MNHRVTEKTPCAVCGRTKSRSELISGEMIRESVRSLIRAEFPEFGPKSFVCLDDLNRYRAVYVERILEEERGELTEIEREVVANLARHEVLSEDVNREFERRATVGERVADRVAAVGGSWAFVLGFFGFIVVWMTVNSVMLLYRPFDPYPYILLNLVLSCLAAVQAPIIMMSQNRQEAKDRLRSENDYQVNLKAELEIRLLSERFDRLLGRQWQNLLEIQDIQVQLMSQLADRGKR